MDDSSLLPTVDAACERGDLDAALAAVLAHFRADSGTIHYLGQDGLLQLAAASRGMPEPVLDKIRAIPVGKGMAGLAVERNEPVTACNLQTDDSGDVRPGARLTGLQGSIVVPIRDGDAVCGALGIANQAERTFTDAEVATLTEVAARLAATAQH